MSIQDRRDRLPAFSPPSTPSSRSQIRSATKLDSGSEREGISRWSSETATPVRHRPHQTTFNTSLLGTGLQALHLPRKISFRRSSVGSTEKSPAPETAQGHLPDYLTKSTTRNTVADEKSNSIGKKTRGDHKKRGTIISQPILLSTPEQQKLADQKGYETMSLVSGRLQQELGKGSGDGMNGGRGGAGKTASTSSAAQRKNGTGNRSTDVQRKQTSLTGGYEPGRYRLGTHREGEEDEDSTEPEARHLARKKSVKKPAGLEHVSPASPPLSPGEGFLAKDLGRGPYLSQNNHSHHGHSRQAPPPPHQGHRQTYSQTSAASAQGRRVDSNVSWVPFDPTMENGSIRSPVESFTAGLGARGGNGGNKASAEEILRGSTLCALYLVSGLPKDVKSWSLADKDAIKGVEPLEDALPCRFRPEVLGRTFGGQNPPDPNLRSAGASMTSLAESSRAAHSFVSLADTKAGGSPLEAAAGGKLHKIVNKSLKYSHPREVEIVNSTLALPTTTHLFSFTIPEDESLMGTRSLGRSTRAPLQSSPLAGNRTIDDNARETTWYGVCLTVWNHADPERARRLSLVKKKLNTSAQDILAADESTLMAGTSSISLAAPAQQNSRASDGNNMRRRVSGNKSGSETEPTWTDSEYEGARNPRQALRGSFLSQSLVFSDADGELADAFQAEADGMFWIPYSLTLVSKYPIYDCMIDYLKLSWARFSKNVKAHSMQISRILNYPTPRAGDAIKLLAGSPGNTHVEINADMPGSVDLRTGLVHVNYRLWPLWQMLSVDNILTILDVALSNSGRVVVASRYPEALGLAVKDLTYVAELRGWHGLSLPLLHARDVTVLVEDPGPYILGINAECRSMVDLMPDMLVVDLDNNHLSNPTLPPGVVSPRVLRDKMRQRILSCFGSFYVADHSVPSELKLSYPGGKVRASCGNALGYANPTFLGDALRAPAWWKTTDIMSTLNQILAEKSKKPTFIQRLIKGSPARQTRPTVAEELARKAMRNRALHYVQARDDFEQKVARINRRLIHLIREGEAWKKRFEKFERYADRLGAEAAELKARIEAEKKEAKRLSGVVNQTKERNTALYDELKKTENAKEEAMKQLSDMHISIQELEKERDEVMNAIELQIENVMVNILDDRSDMASVTDGLRTPTAITYEPGHSPSAWKGTGDYRAKRNTVVTFSSNDGQPVRVPSILQGDGHSARDVKKRRSSVTTANSSTRDPLRQLDQRLTIKSEKMAEKMASIQRKLDMALQAVAEDHAGDEGDEPITKLTLKAKRSRRDVKKAQSENQPGDTAEEIKPQAGETAVATTGTAVSAVDDGEVTPVAGPKSGSKTIHRVRSNTVLATITTVIKMEEPGHGHHHRRASVDSRVKHGEARSRVSLVPELEDQLDLSVVPGDDDEYMSAGEGEEDTTASIIEDSDSLRDTPAKGKAREIMTPAVRGVV